MTTRTEQLEAAKTLGLNFVLFNKDEVHGAYRNAEVAMQEMEELDHEVEDGDLVIIYAPDGSHYSGNALPNYEED